MSWDDFTRRRKAILAVLDYALVRRAWAECAQAQPTLRRLLDTTSAEFATSPRGALCDQGELMTSADIGHSTKVPRHSTPYVA